MAFNPEVALFNLLEDAQTSEELLSVIDALNTISWKYDDTNCDKISEDLTTQLTQHLEAKV